MDNKKEFIKNMTSSEKVKYFFEYYTGRTIAIAIALAVVGYLIYTFASRVEPDFFVLYAGNQMVEGPDEAAIEKAFEPYITDKNKDGKKIVHLINISIDKNVSQVEYNSVMQQKILIETTSGHSLFYILSPEMLNEFNNSSFIANISDINKTNDGISVKLKDTKLKDSEAFSKFPDNYVVALRKPFASGKVKTQNKYNSKFDYSKNVLKNMIK